MAPSTQPVPCPDWAIPGSSNLPQPDPGQETSCARLGGAGCGGTREHDSCYFLEAIVGHNPDSCLAPHFTRQLLPSSNPRHGTPFPSVSTISDSSKGHSLTVLVVAGRHCLTYVLVWGWGKWWSLQGSTGGGGTPTFPPPACLPTRLLPPTPHAPNSPHACLSLTARTNTWLHGHPLF